MKLVAPVYKLNPLQERILEFRGYNKKSVINDGEMRDMYNLSSDEFPCLYQRKPRGIYSESFVHPTAMIVKNKKLGHLCELPVSRSLLPAWASSKEIGLER